MAKKTFDYTKPARTRIAPSPTGELALHHLRQMLYDVALARKTGGQFIFRIENTDDKREVEGSADRMMDLTAEYGLKWDEGERVGGPYTPYDQVSRTKEGIYKKVFDKLLEEGKVYRCFCSAERLEEMRAEMKAKGKVPMYDKHCRNISLEESSKRAESESFTIRIKMPENEKIEFDDALRGKMTWNTNDVDDYILVKSNGIPTYHGAVVIDDYEMKITHVIRSSEWIPTTPVYITLAKYLGYELPLIIHPSVLLDPNGKGKMSKRKNGELVFARSYLDKGYPPQAVLNFLMFLGWSHPDEKVNLLSLEDFIQAFSIERLQPQPSKVDFAKIDWYGGQYIRMMSTDELFEKIKNWLENIHHEEIKARSEVWKERMNIEPNHFKKVLTLIQDRMRKYSDLFEMAEFFYSKPVTDLIEWDKTKHTEEECRGVFPGLKIELEKIAEENVWTQEKWEKAVRDYADICGWKHGDMFMLLRLGVVGSPFSPNLLEAMNLIGAEECMLRLNSI